MLWILYLLTAAVVAIARTLLNKVGGDAATCSRIVSRALTMLSGYGDPPTSIMRTLAVWTGDIPHKLNKVRER